MLKRCQILLTDWQYEHYKFVAEKYDISFSEMIRLALCLDTLFATSVSFPKHKTKVKKAALTQAIRTKKLSGSVNIGKFHQLISRIYFEARKASELWKKDKW